MYLSILVRIIDLLLSIILIIITIPLYIIIFLLILFIDGYPIFFISNRIGKNGKIFKFFKFRTMKNNNITLLGKFLRRSSIDELPQLFNVLFGHMSFVGPRPLPIEYENQFSEQNIYLRRSVLPGITGYCQIFYNGNKRSWNEKIKYDIYFIKNQSLKLYLFILFKTFKVLIIRFTKNKSGDTL